MIAAFSETSAGCDAGKKTETVPIIAHNVATIQAKVITFRFNVSNKGAVAISATKI